MFTSRKQNLIHHRTVSDNTSTLDKDYADSNIIKTISKQNSLSKSSQIKKVSSSKITNLNLITNTTKLLNFEEFGNFIGNVKTSRENVRKYKFETLESNPNFNLHSTRNTPSKDIIKKHKSKSVSINLHNIKRIKKSKSYDQFQNTLNLDKINKNYFNEKPKISVKFFKRKIIQSNHKNNKSQDLSQYSTNSNSQNYSNFINLHKRNSTNKINMSKINMSSLNKSKLSMINTNTNNKELNYPKNNLLNERLTILNEKINSANLKSNIDINKLNFKNVANYRQYINLSGVQIKNNRNIQNENNNLNKINNNNLNNNIATHYKLYQMNNKNSQSQNDPTRFKILERIEEKSTISNIIDQLLISSPRKKINKEDLQIKFNDDENENNNSKISLKINMMNLSFDGKGKLLEIPHFNENIQDNYTSKTSQNNLIQNNLEDSIINKSENKIKLCRKINSFPININHSKIGCENNSEKNLNEYNNNKTSYNKIVKMSINLMKPNKYNNNYGIENVTFQKENISNKNRLEVTKTPLQYDSNNMKNISLSPSPNQERNNIKIIHTPETCKKINNYKVFKGKGIKKSNFIYSTNKINKSSSQETTPEKIWTNKINPHQSFQSPMIKSSIINKLLYNDEDENELNIQESNNTPNLIKIIPDSRPNRERSIEIKNLKFNKVKDSSNKKQIKTKKNFLQLSNFENIINNNLSFFNNKNVNSSMFLPNKDLSLDYNKSNIETERNLNRDDFTLTSNLNLISQTESNLNKPNITKMSKIALRGSIKKLINISKENSAKKINENLEIKNLINLENKSNSSGKSDDECNFSGDEKAEITSVPMFNNKRLTNYNFSCQSINNLKAKDISNKLKMMTLNNKKFYSVLKYSNEVKDSILSFINYTDIVNLNLTSKFLKKITSYKITEKIENVILDEKNNPIFRLKIWKSIYKYSSLSKMKYLKKEYLDNLFKKSNYEDEIKKDMNRTLPEDPNFQQGKTNYKKLFNILIAYSNFNLKIGYAQGLNFLVARIIPFLTEEEEVFIFLDALLNKYDFNNLIGIDNFNLRKRLDEIGKLIEENIPDLFYYFEDNLLNHEFFTTNWVITIFSNAVKIQNLFKIWDFFLIYGWKFLYYFIVSLLINFEDEILKSDPNQLSLKIKTLLKSEQFDKSFRLIVRNALEMINEL